MEPLLAAASLAVFRSRLATRVALVFFRAKSPLLYVFLYYAFPARWTGNAKIRRAYGARSPANQKKTGLGLGVSYPENIMGTWLASILRVMGR